MTVKRVHFKLPHTQRRKILHLYVVICVKTVYHLYGNNLRFP
jgi:hypothetical protein